MKRAPLIVTLAAAASVAAPAAIAQTGSAEVTLRAVPAVPVRGTVVRLVVQFTDSSGTLPGVEGEAAGEPLHFEEVGRSYKSLAAVPVEGPDSLAVALRISGRRGPDTVVLALPLATPTYATERLRVAPKYVELDSATQARVDREVSEARAIGRTAHETGRLWTGRFATPRPGRVTSRFGTAREFNGEVTSRHFGTDFAGKTGEPVRAAGRGVVALVADFYLAGHAVYLNHGGGLVTGYFHLSRVDVAAGDTVARGQVIGGVGRSGRATGPHLHWIARYGAITVDPLSLLEL
jgi:murein DD-endopeptidase MepM/ murein hydrolase activator NlpD